MRKSVKSDHALMLIGRAPSCQSGGSSSRRLSSSLSPVSEQQGIHDATLRRHLEVLEHILSRGRLEGPRVLYEELPDDSVLHDHGVALAARAETRSGASRARPIARVNSPLPSPS